MKQVPWFPLGQLLIFVNKGLQLYHPVLIFHPCQRQTKASAMKPFASSARGLVADLIISQGENYTCLVILRQARFEGKGNCI
jgi:hypothetical protein